MEVKTTRYRLAEILAVTVFVGSVLDPGQAVHR